MLKWGLVPSWAKRCLIPADGFYEWAAVGGKKRATHFHLKDRSLFAFAGLWEFWTDGTVKLATCSIITTDANELVGSIHSRMPVIVPRRAYGRWLSVETQRAEIQAILKPYPTGEMDAVPVGRAVNSPRNDGPECLQPAA